MSPNSYAINQAMCTIFGCNRDATQSALEFVCPSVCDVDVSWSHRLEYFKNNFMAD